MDNHVRKLVIYYSLEGNTAFIAKTIAETIQADLLELKPKKDIKSKGFMRFFWGGKQVMMKKTPELLPFDKNPADYDLIILGTPVWASNYVPAFRTFFSSSPLRNKHLAFFCCYAGNEGKTFKNMKHALSENTFIGEIGFCNPLKEADRYAKIAEDWAKELVLKLN